MGCCLNKPVENVNSVKSVKSIRNSKDKSSFRNSHASIELYLPHRDSEKAIQEYLETLKKQNVSFSELVERIGRIMKYVQKNVTFDDSNLILFQKINDGLKLITVRFDPNKEFVVNIVLNDLIQALLLIDFIYHPGSPAPPGENSTDKELRLFEDDKKRWLPFNIVEDIKAKSCAVSQNKNLKTVLQVMIKIIEDDLGLSKKEEIQLPREVAAVHIEKIMNPE